MTDVGERALVAYERPNGRYDVHYSHWGAHQWQLASAITPARPYGGSGVAKGTHESPEDTARPPDRPDEPPDDTAQPSEDTTRPPDGPNEPPDHTPGRSTGVDPAPLATDCSFEELLDSHVDFQTVEACYLVSEDVAVTPFLSCWFGLPGIDRTRTHDGALVSVDPSAAATDGEFLRSWVAGAKAVALALVERGTVDAADARSLLAAEVAGLRTAGRTVRFGPDATPGNDRT